MEKADWIVLMRVEMEGEAVEPVPGSHIVPCDACEQPCWIAPSGQAAIAKGITDKKICTFCALKIMIKMKEEKDANES